MLLGLVEESIQPEILPDLSDSVAIPYEMQGGTHIEIGFQEAASTQYTLYIPHYLLQFPKLLLVRLTHSLIRISLTEQKLPYDTGGDTEAFLYLTGVFMGFGGLISQCLFEVGRASSGMWEEQWWHLSPLPLEVMGFSLALYASLLNTLDLPWRENLPQGLSDVFEKSIFYLEENPSALINSEEQFAQQNLEKALTKIELFHYREAISLLEESLSLSSDEFFQAELHNALGYCRLRLGEAKKGVAHFHKALEIFPEFGVAYDNLGYAYLILGEWESGKSCLAEAQKTGNNIMAYNLRNYALYYRAIGDEAQAEACFQEAFRLQEEAVDLLELSYAEYLLAHGKEDEGIRYLKLAVEKGEPEALRKWEEIQAR